MALVSMFLCNQSYASHGRDFLLGATILNFDGYCHSFIDCLFLFDYKATIKNSWVLRSAKFGLSYFAVK